ncbi:MAG: hypothetical protein IJH82_07610 [Lachnospiraceae bacterium]|nr:hypothetical protein [Lachnospiraceae bacterium]
MRLVKIKPEVLKKYSADKQIMQKDERPSVLIMRLLYKGQNYTFAVPVRSNIPAASPKDEYFPLPTRSTTKDGRRHGIHYIKMFPIKPSDAVLYRTDGNLYAALVKGVIDKHEKQIIKECQDYLQWYENGRHPEYATDIDYLLTLL